MKAGLVGWNAHPDWALAVSAAVVKQRIMPQARYFIVRNDDNWMIRYAEEEFGPYRTQAEALLFAIDAAQKLGEHGANSQVCLMGENGYFRPEWTYGHDAYPPRI
jgi:hypothetical protein